MPDNKEISALTTAEQTSNNDLFETSIPNAMTDTGYVSRKQSVTMLEQQMLGNTQYNTELPNFTAGNRTIFKALEEARSSGGGGASVIQKTMAEYTALPSADKMNGSIYKITDKALIYCLDEEYHAVLEITSADYAQLTSAEKNNGTLYVLTDEETTADDIPYSAGVSVADKIDDMSIALDKVIATIKEVDIKLGDTVWNGVYYGEASIQNWVNTYGTCISAIVVEEGNDTLSAHYNRFAAAQIITDTAYGANEIKVRAYSPQASNSAENTVRIRLTFIKTYAS